MASTRPPNPLEASSNDGGGACFFFFPKTRFIVVAVLVVLVAVVISCCTVVESICGELEENQKRRVSSFSGFSLLSSLLLFVLFVLFVVAVVRCRGRALKIATGDPTVWVVKSIPEKGSENVESRMQHLKQTVNIPMTK